MSNTPAPDPTLSPSPVPSLSVTPTAAAETDPTNAPWTDLFTVPATPTAMTSTAALVDSTVKYDGPPKTGKTLRDLSIDLGLTGSFAELVDDMQEAVLGITADLTGKSDRKSVGDILAHGNRLRGLGALLVLGAVAGLLVDFVSGDSLVRISAD